MQNENNTPVINTGDTRRTDKIFKNIVIAVTAIVLVVVIALKLLPPPAHIPGFIVYLPHIIGAINATCAVLLIISFIQIRRGNVSAHKRLNIVTFILSALFLVFYILFHLYHKDTVYGDADHNGIRSAAENAAVGITKYFYFGVLITHILLATCVLPLILISFYRGFNMQIPKHKKIVRWAYPIWLYVAISGVVVYLMISPYYNF